MKKHLREVTSLQQRLESAYEDMGGILNKYYKVNEALSDSPEEEIPVDEDYNHFPKSFEKN